MFCLERGDCMQSIYNALLSFFDLIGSLVEFIIDMIKDLVYVIGLLGEMIAKIPQYIGWLPSNAILLITTVFSIVVIYKILGREG